MRAIARPRSLTVAAATLLLQASLFAQAPPGRNVPGSGGSVPPDLEFGRVVADLDRGGEDAGILAQPEALRAFGHESVASLLAHRNRYIKALAIAELKNRKDRTRHDQIHELFGTLSPDIPVSHRDPHNDDAIPPDAALLAASAEYLATIDKTAFLGDLLNRPEMWDAPHWFVAAFRQMGPGWIRASLGGDADPARRSVLGSVIRGGATEENVAELQELLGAEDPGLWASAVVACERLDHPDCWAAVEGSLGARDNLDRLKVRMAQWRTHRTDPDGLMAAADSVAAMALHEPAGPARARMWNVLDEFVRLAVGSQLAIPASLASRLRALGSPVIATDLATAGIQ
jgi:hypothetical protein